MVRAVLRRSRTAGVPVEMIGAVGRADGTPLIEMLDTERIETRGIARVDGTPSAEQRVLRRVA